jgi:hypothetical protein
LFSSDAAGAKVFAGSKNKISNPIFSFLNNLLVVVSSDSQVGHKFGNDTAAGLRIIKG